MNQADLILILFFNLFTMSIKFNGVSHGKTGIMRSSLFFTWPVLLLLDVHE